MTDYNGYTNRATWNVCLWLGNDQGLYNAVRDQVRGITATGQTLNAHGAELLVRDLMPDRTPDGLTYENVNWSEVADCMTELGAD
jgi:hypothetical protein